MSQIPPPAVPPGPPGYGVPGAKRTNGFAITSLILGIVQCVPFLCGILAIIFGIVGLKKAKDPNVGGKGMAVAGLILGVVGLVIWTLFIGGAVGGAAYIYKQSEPAAEVARGFVNDLSAGNLDAAMGRCHETMDREVVRQAMEAVQSWGAVKDITLPARAVNSANGVTDWNLGGAVTFEQSSKAYTVVLRKDGETYKIIQFNLQ